MIFAIRTSVLKHIAFLLLWVRKNASEFIRTNSFVLVCAIFFTEIGRFAFLRPPLGDLGVTYDDHLRLIGKRVVDFR